MISSKISGRAPPVGARMRYRLIGRDGRGPLRASPDYQAGAALGDVEKAALADALGGHDKADEGAGVDAVRDLGGPPVAAVGFGAHAGATNRVAGPTLE